jgi:hypothetical protein
MEWYRRTVQEIVCISSGKPCIVSAYLKAAISSGNGIAPIRLPEPQEKLTNW